jgi:5-methylcytosine-specific restriction protein A
MSVAPPRPCTRCRRRLATASGLCASCRRARAHDRPSAAARGYDGTWAIIAKHWLRAHPLCGERRDGQLHAEDSLCVQRGDRHPADCVDHIRPLTAGGARIDPANLQSLCTRCNVLKGGRVRADRD